MTRRRIRLDQLAQAMGLEHRTACRWAARGLVRARVLGRGKGLATTLSREQSIELAALVLLRRAGVPMQKLSALVRRLRREGKRGRDFLSLGAARQRALRDGDGAGLPLWDPRTRQAHLFVALDLRELAPTLEHIIDEVQRASANPTRSTPAARTAAGRRTVPTGANRPT